LIVVLSWSALAAALLPTGRAQVFPIATNPAVFELGGGAVFDGSNYLVGFVSGTNIVGQRISPTGALVGAPVVVGTNVGFPPAVAIAGARTNALVAWSDYSRSNGVTMFGRIWAHGSGAPGAAFPLLASVGSHGFQTVQAAASDGTNYLVVWRDSAQNNFYGQFVSAAGTLSGPEFLLFSGPGEEASLALAFGRTNYLLAWQGGEDTEDTYARTVAPGGALGSVVKLSATASRDLNPLAIGFDGMNYLVTWNCTTNYGGPGELMLAGRLVSPSGTPLGAEQILVTERASVPAVAFDGAHYLLAWGYNTATTNSDINIRARFLDRSGNAIGPVITPFPPRGSNPPLLPLNGVLFDGNRFLLTATYGSFVMDPNGDIVGFNGGDVYGRFLPRSTTPPVFTNAALINGRFQGQLQVVPGVTYTLEISTNLTSWQPVDAVSSDGTNLLHLEDDQPATALPRLFVRAAVGWTGTPSFEFWFFEFANGGGFGGGVTPSPSYPVTLRNYSAALGVANDINFPPAAQVYFTGPAGSGLANTPAWLTVGGNDWQGYQSPPVFSPAAAPGGNWVVNYKGTNVNFTVPDPQAASRLVVPLPTVSVSSGVLQSLSWVYKNAATGATLGGAPAYLTNIQVQLEGIGGSRIYNSPELPPGVTNHTLSTSVNWSQVSMVHMAYKDTLGNRYVVSFSKP